MAARYSTRVETDVVVASGQATDTRELLWVLGWAAAWLVPFGTFVLVLAPGGYGMFGRSWVGGLWFLLATAGVALCFRRELRAPDTGKPTGIWPSVALGSCGALTIACYALADANWPLAPDVFERFHALQFGLVRMDAIYLTVKIPDLIFQQTLIYVLVRHLQLRGLTGWPLIGAFMLPFAGIHAPLLVVKGLAGLPVLIASVVASLVFVPLIARLKRGVVFSFCVHHLFYVLAGLALRASL